MAKIRKNVSKRKQKSIRREKFEQIRRDELLTGNKAGPEHAAVQAGYSPSYARSRAAELDADVRIEIMQSFRARQFTGDTVARNIIDLTRAKTPKWNQKKNKWDVFGDSNVQLQANIAAAKLMGWAEPREQGDTRPIQIIIPTHFPE